MQSVYIKYFQYIRHRISLFLMWLILHVELTDHKHRLPFISPLLFTITPALSSKYINTPFFLRTDLRCRTTTAGITARERILLETLLKSCVTSLPFSYIPSYRPLTASTKGVLGSPSEFLRGFRGFLTPFPTPGIFFQICYADKIKYSYHWVSCQIQALIFTQLQFYFYNFSPRIPYLGIISCSTRKS